MPLRNLLARLKHFASQECIQDIFVYITISTATYIISNYYVLGDQVGYQDAYRAVRGVNFFVGFDLYTYFISTTEFVHYLFIYIISNFMVDKNLAMAVLNGMFSAQLLRIFRSFGVNIFVSLSIIFTNYYLFVLYLAAERLKISMMLILIACLLSRNIYVKYAVYFTAISAHVSTLFLFSGILLQDLLTLHRRSGSKITRFISLFFVSIIVLFVSNHYFGEYVYWKVSQYYVTSNISMWSTVPLIVYVTASTYYAKNRINVVFTIFLLP